MEYKSAKDGQSKCPKCGSTDISLNEKTGLLRCNFCRYEFQSELYKDADIEGLEGFNLTAGAGDIDYESSDIVTLKCQSCGAEVVIDTASVPYARCHWCRNTLSLNDQIANGAIADVLLPFKIRKEEARKSIEEFVHKRRFFAHPTFLREFTSDNICGVYFPYMVIDINGHMELSGLGEIEVRRYRVGSKNNKVTYYDADAYYVDRDFDFLIDDLTIEASSDKLDVKTKDKTNNIINSIMPFDTENCVKFDSNYLKGYSSEKRDINVDYIKDLVHNQASDVAKFSANDTLKRYDRGVAWEKEDLSIKGESWKAAYLPVWLYSYMQINGDQKLLHYVAVNARTKETMGSVPLNFKKLFLISFLIEMFCGYTWINVNDYTDFGDSPYSFLIFLPGILFFIIQYMRYRNSSARHTYEKETKISVLNLKKKDNFYKRRLGLTNSRIKGANNHKLRAFQEGMLDSLKHNIKFMGMDIDEIVEDGRNFFSADEDKDN